MKLRTGFVSNSSSTSYYIMAPAHLAKKSMKKLEAAERFFMEHSYMINTVTYLGKKFWVLFGEVGSEVGPTVEWEKITDERIDEGQVIDNIIDALRSVGADSEVLVFAEAG